MALTTNPPVQTRRVVSLSDQEQRQLPARGTCLIRLPDLAHPPHDRRLSARVNAFLEELDRTVFRYLQSIRHVVTHLGELSFTLLVRHPKWAAGVSFVVILQLAAIILWTDSKPEVIDDLKSIAPPMTQSAAVNTVLPSTDSAMLPGLNLPVISAPASQSPTLVNPLDGHQVDQVRPTVVAERPGESPNDCFLPPQARANEAGALQHNEMIREADARISSRPSRPVLPPPAPVQMDAPIVAPTGASLEGRIIPQAGF